ncbi:MAG: phage tail protein [Acidobacteriota bacterium]
MNQLLEYLPAIFREDSFAEQFLRAFEAFFLNHNDKRVSITGLESIIANIATFFDPTEAREDFLPWLAEWVAFSLKANLTVEQQRKFLANIVSFYTWRGTKKNWQQLMEIFKIGVLIIEDQVIDDQGNIHQLEPHCFHIKLYLTGLDYEQIQRQIRIALSLIELEKPAHTKYTYDLIFPANFQSLEIGKSQIGIDTLLGSITKP